MSDAEDLKRQAAARALEFVTDGMRLGLGTGSTAKLFVDLLAVRVREGLDVVGVPTSERTRAQAQELGIKLATLDSVPELDLCIDGADEVGPGLALIKGGGGALLREKIVASAAREMVVIADASKHVRMLGRFPLPVEVVDFAIPATRLRLTAALREAGCAGALKLRRMASGEVFHTDQGNVILDAHLERIPDPAGLDDALNRVVGVVEHGLFLGLARRVVLAGDQGIEILQDPGCVG